MMKTTQKGKKLWWILAAVAVVLIAAGVCAALFLRPAAPIEQEQPGVSSIVSKLYWNLDGESFMENSESGLTTREPDANGVYTIRFICDGQIVELKSLDAQLVNYMDNLNLMGLVFDDSGYIVDAVKGKEVATELAKDAFVKTCDEQMLVLNSSMAMNGMPMEFTVTGQLHIVDVRKDAPEPGAQVTLETMDKVLVYGGEDGNATHVFLIERQQMAGVYIRVDQKWDSANACTSRVPDENGVYTILMAHEGKQVEMKCKDKSLVTDIDYGSDANQFKGLYLDDEGYIIDVVTVNVAIRGIQKCNVYHVTAIEGNQVTVERLLFHTGKVETFTVDETTKIYNTDYLADCLFDYVGQPVESLQLNDRVIVYTDVFGTAKYVFLTKRMVEGIKLYYNKTVMYDGTKQETTRPKDSKGYYVFEMGCEGKTVTVKTKDKDLAGRIERKYLQFMGLEVENGIVKRIYDPSCITGFLAVGNNMSVTELTGNILRLVPGGNPDGGANYILADNVEVYNITGDYGTKYYQKDTLQQYDTVVAFRDIYGDISHVMIQQRYQSGTKVYYNISRKYDSVNQVTTRVPDEEGYYVFDMLCDGNRVKVKTKNKEIATIIDRQYSPFAALKVKDGIVKEAYAAASAFPAGTKVANYNYIGKMEGDTFNTYYYTNEGEVKWQAATFKLAKNCKVYNVSENYSKAYGEQTKIQMHDQIQGFAANENQEVVAIYVLSRKLDGDIYWPVNRQFDSNKLVSTRVPDAEGWYYVDLAIKGEIKTFKTKEAVVINRVDSYSTGFAMEVKGDVIQKAGSANSALNYGGTAVSNLDVAKITEKKLTVERMRPGEADSGKQTELELAKNYKVYDVSSYAVPFGAPAELSFGDRIIAYRNKDGKICEIYIVNKNTHKDGAVSRCPHCDQDVFWEPYLGVIHTGNMHYYMAGDFLTWQRQIGADDAGATTYDVVLDLNGKTLNSYGRNFLVYDKLTIMDLAGGGRMEGSGVDGWATSILVLNGGELNIMSGTITTAADSKTATNGGLIYAQANCTINITGGVLEKGKTSGQGGAIYLSGSTLNMTDGEIRDCAAGAGTGLYLVGTSKVNLSGGVIDGTIEGGANSKVTLSGAPKLTGLYVPDGAKVKLGELTEGAEITVTANGVFTEATENAETYKTYFKPAMGQTAIKVENHALSTYKDMTVSNDPLVFQAGTQDAWCSVCHKLVTWTPVTGEESYVQMLGNHYYLANDIAVNAAGNGKEGFLYVSGGSNLGSICLHLNDHDLIVTGHRAIMGGPRPLNVLGNGNVSGYSVGIGSSGAAVHVNAGKGAGVVSLYGGTYTKDATDTESSILYIGYNGGTLNMYEGVLVDATGKTSTTSAAGVFVQGGGNENQGPAYFNMYGGTIQNGTSTVGGGNLRMSNQYGVTKIYGGTITGGSAPEGGNICCLGGTLQFMGGAEENILVSGGNATGGEGGNLRIKDAKQLQLKNVTFLGGTSTNHGGNISIMRVPTTIEGNTLINGGTSKTYGGALRVYQAKVIMTGGEIKGGSANSEWSHNVWLAGTAASPAIFDMRGGTVYATPNYPNANTAIFAHSYSHIYLSGNATIIDGENPVAGMRISNTSKLFIVDGWSGSANVRFADIYSAGAVVPTDYCQVVTVDENLNATVGGSFTGTLYQLINGVLAVEAQDDGSMIIKAIQ